MNNRRSVLFRYTPFIITKHYYHETLSQKKCTFVLTRQHFRLVSVVSLHRDLRI